jgi:DNA (cytosine-5)-methyltransferase 1
MKKFKFVDLFSGVGGFHQALKSEGGVCVFASEIDQECVSVYKSNFDVDSNNDITKTNASDIPKHDVLTGGFPCQAFSKAGKQQGLNDTRGTLFFDIERILKHHKTKYIILENVRNLTSHDHGRTWQVIQHNLKTIGYRLTEKPLILSPHEFGIPHLRERVFIVGKYDPKRVSTPLEIKLDNNFKKSENNVYSILEDKKVDQKYYISK